VPSGNGSCLLHKRGRGGSVSDSEVATVVTTEWRALTEEWTQRGSGHVVDRSLLFWCTTARAFNLARTEEHMGKRHIDRRPRV
jgi:hypothetical protein